MALGYLIRRYRFDYGEMKQQQLADSCGVSRLTVNAIESSNDPPALEVAFRIARTVVTLIKGVFFYKADIEGDHEFKDGVIVGMS